MHSGVCVGYRSHQHETDSQKIGRHDRMSPTLGQHCQLVGDRQRCLSFEGWSRQTQIPTLPAKAVSMVIDSDLQQIKFWHAKSLLPNPVTKTILTLRSAHWSNSNKLHRWANEKWTQLFWRWRAQLQFELITHCWQWLKFQRVTKVQ